jgi:CheY-like chemotaxis protein
MAHRTILVVEDNPLNRELVVDLLEGAGYTVLQADEGVGLLERVKAGQPGLILLDLQLPGLDGVTLASQLKADRAPKYLFDGSPATTWSSAAGKFQGAWVEVSFAPAAITRIQIWGGWQKSDPLYLGSHRPQNVTVSFDGGDPVPLELLDVRKPQGVDIPPELGIVRATRVRITIADVYPAQKTAAKGTPTKDVAISEIRLFGIPVAP